MQPPIEDALPANIDVQAIRDMLQLSRAAFALRYGFELSAIEAWENGSRTPTGPSRTLLLLLDRIPDEIEFALRVN